ncbi:MAG: thioredoxin family protein [Planctomycetaceae bacterium]|nr:thioredoxin family protein [Planctomycetaceae bacterium]
MFRYLLIAGLCLGTVSTAVAQNKLPRLLGGNEFSFGGHSDSSDTGSGELKVTAELLPVDAMTADLKVTVELPSHHYIYSATTPYGTRTKITITQASGFRPDGNMRSDRPPKVVKDDVINETMEKFYDRVTWTQRLKLPAGELKGGMTVSGELTGQYCSDTNCLLIDPPQKFTASLPATIDVPAQGQQSSAVGSSVAASSVVNLVPQMRLPKDLSQPPIRFEVSLQPAAPIPGNDVSLHVKAIIDQPYHTYSVTQNPDVLGTTPTEIILESVDGAEPIGVALSQQEPERKPGLSAKDVVEVHHDQVEWVQKLTATDHLVNVKGRILFQVCNPRECLEVTEVPFVITAGSSPQAVAGVPGTAESNTQDQAAAFGDDSRQAGLIPFILSAISAGFLALLTPCVFPMIPVTVAYFLKQGHEKAGATIRLAVIYCAGIICAFTVLGLLMAVLVGPTALNELANNPWLNLMFAIVFTVFALMLMGMFEIQVPSWLLTWSAKNQESGGIVGVLFMALTFTLVSFTCTFAFVGSLLVWAAQGDYFMPIIGMLAFSTAFASPFFLLALFPGFLKSLPKSGGWMNSVKVTLGLLELAIVTKFLSVADTGLSPTGTPQYLDYHLVMASWIAVATVTGLYLLGRFRMPHDTPTDAVGPVRCVFALGFMGLAVYIATGLFAPKAPEGVLWQQIVAFAPPQINFSSSGDEFFIEHDGLQYALDFDKAVAEASTSNQPMFLDFTGVNCINCRRMEKGVLSTDAVHDVIKDLVRVQLYVDEVPGVKSNPEEHERLLARNRDLQRNWFGDVGIPAYIIATPDGQEILSVFKGLDTTGEEFQQFLRAGLDRWRQRKVTSTESSSLKRSAEIQNASYSIE